jgi:signal transduction histidine kinase
MLVHRTRMVLTAGAAVAVAEGLVVTAWLTSSPASVVAIVQVFMLALLAVTALAGRLMVLRARLHDEIAWEAVVAERSRIAEEMHDTLGHELSLIALRAGALEVAHPDTAERTQSIRRGAERANGTLREILEVLPTAAATAPLAPGGTPLPELIDTARAAGLTVDAELPDLNDLPAVVLETVQQVVREALTNAARHAPGQPVTVRVRRAEDAMTMLVTNPIDERHHSGYEAGTGLQTLRRRLGVLGGSLAAGTHAGGFVVDAVLPCEPRITPLVRRHVPTRSRRWALSIGLPIAALALGVIGYYEWAVQGATTDAATVGRIHVGASETAAARLLPRRQAPVRLSQPPRPAGATVCDYYTDGNFPIGYASWRICFGAGTVVSIDDLR